MSGSETDSGINSSSAPESFMTDYRFSQLDHFLATSVQRALVPTALVSALSYYIGWLANAAYYVSFGILPDMVDKSFTETLAAGWVEIVLMALLGAGGVFVYSSVFSLYETVTSKSERGHASMLYSFWILIFVAGILGMVSLYRLVAFRVAFKSIFLGFVALFFYWAAASIGHQIRHHVNGFKKKRYMVAFHTVFPSLFIHLIIALVILIFLCSRIGIARGVFLAQRDISARGNLPLITIFSKEPILSSFSVPGSYDFARRLYRYDDIKLIVKSDGYMYLLVDRPSKSSMRSADDKFGTISIPSDKIESYELNR